MFAPLAAAAPIYRGLPVDDKAASPAPDNGLERLLGIGVTVHVAAGQTIALEGDPLAHSYRVIRGAVRLYKAIADGRRQVIDFVAEGECFGLLGRTCFPYTAEAMAPTTLVRHSRRQLKATVASSPEAAAGLIDLACQELERTQGQMLLLGRKSAEEKIASFLVTYTARAADGAAEVGAIRLPMSRQDLADYLGLTIETVSRTFSRLKRGGLIELLTPQHVLLLRIEALAEIAEGR